jgi:hypothetical protein
MYIKERRKHVKELDANILKVYLKKRSALEVTEASNEKKIENDCEIRMEEIMKTLKCMKAGKATGYDSVFVEMLRAGQCTVACRLCRHFILINGQIPKDWCKAVIVPLYKGKRSQQECKNNRGISLLSVVGKLYAKILIERVVKETNDKIWDVLAGFHNGVYGSGFFLTMHY